MFPCLSGFLFQLLPLFPLFQGEENRDVFTAGLCQPGDTDPSLSSLTLQRGAPGTLQGHSLLRIPPGTGKIPAGNAPGLRSGADAEFSSPAPRGKEQELQSHHSGAIIFPNFGTGELFAPCVLPQQCWWWIFLESLGNC